MDLNNIKYDTSGLVPAIAQDVNTGQVLMLAYMSEASLKLSIDTGYATYYSRSRQQLWKKGETSGNLQKIISMKYDCDGDAILLLVEQSGPACHTGAMSCFFNNFYGDDINVKSKILEDVYAVIKDRSENPKEGSYTNYLLDKGIEKTCKKVGEESSEIIIGAMKNDRENVIYETSDLLYHVSVLLFQCGITWDEIFSELKKRR